MKSCDEVSLYSYAHLLSKKSPQYKTLLLILDEIELSNDFKDSLFDFNSSEYLLSDSNLLCLKTLATSGSFNLCYSTSHLSN